MNPWPTQALSLSDIDTALSQWRPGMTIEAWREAADEALDEPQKSIRVSIIDAANGILTYAAEHKDMLVKVLRTASSKGREQLVAALHHRAQPWVQKALESFVKSSLFESGPGTTSSWVWDRFHMRRFVDSTIDSTASATARERTTRELTRALRAIGVLEGNLLIHARPDPEVFACLLAIEMHADHRFECSFDWAAEQSKVAKFFCLEKPYASVVAQRSGVGAFFETSYLAGTPRLVLVLGAAKNAA